MMQLSSVCVQSHCDASEHEMWNVLMIENLWFVYLSWLVFSRNPEAVQQLGQFLSPGKFLRMSCSSIISFPTNRENHCGYRLHKDKRRNLPQSVIQQQKKPAATKPTPEARSCKKCGTFGPFFHDSHKTSAQSATLSRSSNKHKENNERKWLKQS